MKITQSKSYNRILIFSDVPQTFKGDPTTVQVSIQYCHDQNEGNMMGKAIALDNQIIPYILKKLNS